MKVVGFLLAVHLVPVQVAGVWRVQGVDNIVLVDTSELRVLLIGVSRDQATALEWGLSGLPSPRPMTHDLLPSMLDSTGWSLKSVVIDSLEGNVFYASVILSRPGKRLKLDARPSDGINLAVRAKCPVLVEEDVLDRFYQELLDALKRKRAGIGI